MDCNSSGCCEVAAATVSYHSSFLTLISSCLSIFGSCLIILTFILWKDVRKSIARIILLFLAIADLCTGMSYLVSSAGFIAYHVQTQNDSNASFNYPIFCTATSFFTTFFPVSSFFWTTNLAVYFFIILVLKKPRWSRKLLIFFNLTAWPIPFIICVTTASFGILGAVAGGDHRNTAGWCFVSLNGTNSYHYDYTTYLLWEALCAKGWELLFFSIVIISYSAIFFVHKKCGCNECISRDSSQTQTNDKYYHLSSSAFAPVVDWKLFMIPVVFIVLRSPGTYRYFLSMTPQCWPNNTTDDCAVTHECFHIGGNYYIIYIQALFGPLQGFGNAILFVFMSKILMVRLRKSIRESILKVVTIGGNHLPNERSSHTDPGEKNDYVYNPISGASPSVIVKFENDKSFNQEANESVSINMKQQADYGGTNINKARKTC